MGRTICLLLLGCLALSSAVPLPGPALEEDLLNMILNAKPEDNDINPTVTETSDDGIMEQELPQPQDLQEIHEDTTTQEVAEEQTDKSDPELLSDDKKSELATPAEAEPVSDIDQKLTELDVPEEDHLLPEEEVAEGEPQADEENPVILVADDQILPLDPQEAPIIIVQETLNKGTLPGDETPFSQDEDEQLLPVSEGEELPDNLEDDDIIVISEGNSDFNTDSSDDDLELVPLAVVKSEDDELSQPLPNEPLIHGLIIEDTQADEDVSPFVISTLDENPLIEDDSEIPVYFDYVNIPEPARVNYEGESQLFTDPIFRSPPVYPSEDNYQPNNEPLNVYYVPESRFPIDDNRYENPEMKSNFFVNQAEAVPEKEIIPDDEFSTESSGQLFGDEVPDEESLIAENADHDTSNQDLIPEYHLTEEAPDYFDQDQMSLGEQEFEKIGTVIVLEAPESPIDSLEPSLEIIPLDDVPADQEAFPMEGPMMPGDIHASLMTPDSQPMIDNDQIMPVAEFPEEGILPINYFIPNNEDQQSVIYPEEYAPHHDLPVFPQNWNGDISMPAAEESLHPAILSQYNEAPAFNTFSNTPLSHGPSPPQEPTEEQTKSVFDFADDEMPSKNFDFIISPEIPQYPREDIITTYDNDDESVFGPSGHIHIPNEFPQTFGYPNFRTSFNRPASFAFQQDYRGPNTFPLNFRRPDFSSQMTGTYYNPFNDRTASYSNVNENMFLDSSVTPQNFRQVSNVGNNPKAFPNTQNMFFSMLNEPVKMIQDNDGQNMNLQTFQNLPTFMGSDRFNQQDQPYDVQLTIIPYETSYNVPSYSQNRRQQVAYPYAQQSNNYDTYQGFSYNYPGYGGSNFFTQSGFFSNPSNRYEMSYNFENQNENDRRFNYPVPTW